MPKRSYLTIEDRQTGEYRVFTTIQNACLWIEGITGKHIYPTTLREAFLKKGTVCKKRFKCNPDNKTVMAEPDQTTKEKEWEFTQFELANTVLVAERKFRWYDELKMEAITKYLRDKACRVFWDTVSEETNSTRHNTRIEIYKKYPENISFNDKISDMKEMISKIDEYINEVS